MLLTYFTDCTHFTYLTLLAYLLTHSLTHSLTQFFSAVESLDNNLNDATTAFFQIC